MFDSESHVSVIARNGAPPRPVVSASLKKQLFKIFPFDSGFSTLLRALMTMLPPLSIFREFFGHFAVAALTFFCLEAWRKAVGKPKAERDLQDESKDHKVLQQNPQNLPDLAASNGDLRPRSLPSPRYLPNFGEFIQAANNALDHAYPKQQQLTVPRYTRVTVLLIQWLKDDLGVTPELEKLGNVFRDIYGYDVRPIYSIPETGSDSALLTQIEQLTQDAAPDHLLIVYYGGHSDDSDPVNSIWRRYETLPNITISINVCF